MREKSDSDLVDLVIDEVERFSKMTREERNEISKPPEWPLIYGLPNKQGVEITCGNRAHAAISLLSDRVHQSDEVLRRRCSKDAAFQMYRKHFVRSLSKATVDGELDQTSFAAHYSLVISRLLRQNARDLRFGIPCVLPIGAAPTRGYVLGPVEFVPVQAWVENFSNEYPSATPLDEQFKNDLAWFPWIAFLTITRTESKRGQQLAETTVDAAINIVRIFLVIAGRLPDVYRLGHAGGRLPPNRKCGISFENAIPKMWFSRQSHPYVGNDFIEYLESQDHYIQMCAGALRPATFGLETTSSCARFLDALKWFGEACLEGRSGAQIVKSVMCLERLVIFSDDKGGLKERVAKRVAALLSVFGDANYADLKAELGRAYKQRSDLMHGAVGPMEQSFDTEPYDVLRLAARALISFTGLAASRSVEKAKDAYLRDSMMSLVRNFESFSE